MRVYNVVSVYWKESRIGWYYRVQLDGKRVEKATGVSINNKAGREAGQDSLIGPSGSRASRASSALSGAIHFGSVRLRVEAKNGRRNTKDSYQGWQK